MTAVTIVGNITRDPETRFTPSGLPVTSFGVAVGRRRKDGVKHTSIEITADDVGASMRWATVSVTKAERRAPESNSEPAPAFDPAQEPF